MIAKFAAGARLKRKAGSLVAATMATTANAKATTQTHAAAPNGA
jgi:hypothetical protein